MGERSTKAKPKGAPRAAGKRTGKFSISYIRGKIRKKEREVKRKEKLARLAEKRKSLKASIKVRDEGIRTISAFSTGLTMSGFKRRYPKYEEGK